MRPNPQEIADLVEFTEEILHEKLQFLYNARRTFVMELFTCNFSETTSLFSFEFFKTFRKKSCPVDTQRRFNVDTTSCEVVSTLKRLRVSTG